MCMYAAWQWAIRRSLSHTFFFYEFFTVQLNTIDGRVFDMDLYIGENEREMKSIRDRKMRQHAWWWSLYAARVHTNLY
jgi:hypothetical protein